MALADPIGPEDCINRSCFGSIYTLTYLGELPNSVYRIQLDIDTEGYSGSGERIRTVGIKVSASASAASLEQAPGGIVNWDVDFNSGVNASGCTGSGNGFDCANDITALANLEIPIGQAPVPGLGVYTWIFDVTVPSGTLFFDDFGSEVKALYEYWVPPTYKNDGSLKKPGEWKQAGITSEPITLQLPPCTGDACGGDVPVPEPSSLLLLGAGIASLGLIALRKRSK